MIRSSHDPSARLRNKRWAAVFAMAVIVTFAIAMVIPVEYIPFGGRYDKIKHGIFFVVMTLSLKSFLKTNIWLLGAGLAVFAVLSEVVQHLIPHRSGNVDDLYADWIGIGVTCCIWQIGEWFLKFVNRGKS